MERVMTDQERNLILEEAERYARQELGGDTTGHDWWHASRVAQTARGLAEEEGADVFLSVLAALLHDVADEKLNESKESGLAKVRHWLSEQNLPDREREHVLDIIGGLSYRGGNNPPMTTLEGMVVQDADRLDAIGAIAIARVFQYSGATGRPIHDPGIAPRMSMTPEEYRSHKGTAINHFHEKLFRLKDLINTGSARVIAERRHAYMEEYMQRFLEEWNGGDGL